MRSFFVIYVYSDHSILECYNLFSGVELSMRSFFVIICTYSSLFYSDRQFTCLGAENSSPNRFVLHFQRQINIIWKDKNKLSI